MDSPADEIFCEARELAPGAREGFLDDACAGNPDLRREVEILLADAAGADAFFAATFGDRGESPRHRGFSVENAGDAVGPFTLLEKIGEGGCGVVWMAGQTKPISRRVAVKVIKAGMDTEEVLSRFESERQALARMDHPNIARVLDAGATDKGRPYFAMELVNGIRITRFCDEHHLDTKARLALFSDVCAAVNHAHQKGVIHRDIKPSNVLVALDGDRPVVKVIDFGIAKAVEGKLADHSMLTRLGQPVGTPAYMSPEQAGLDGQDIDTRSDIYGLGVLLYELLAGVPPFDPRTLVRAGYDEMRRIIREVDPVRPSARLTTLSADKLGPIAAARQVSGDRLHRIIASDLDWIVMKAIEKSRDRRYETADSLAQDIGRFVADEPVAAKPPTAIYLLRKFAKRNRTGLWVAFGFALLLVVATAVSAGQAVRAMRAEALAERRLADALTAKDAKDRALKDAEAVSKFLAEAFRRADPEVDGRTVTVAQALDAATAKLNDDLSGQPVRLALLQETLADTYAGIGIFPKSLDLRKSVLATRRGSLGVDDPATLSAMTRLVATLSLLGYYQEARDLGEEEVAGRRRVNGSDDAATLGAMESLAANFFHSGQHDKAIATQNDFLNRVVSAHGTSDPRSVAAMRVLSNYYRQSGDIKSADELARKASPQNGDGAAPLTDGEHHAMVKQKLREKEEELMRIREKNGPADRETLAFLKNLAASYYSSTYRDEAIRVQDELVALLRKKHGDEHPETIEAEDALAYFLWRNNRMGEAVELKKKLLVRRSKIFGPEHAETLTARADLAGYVQLGGKTVEAQAMLEESLPLMRKVIGSADRRTLNAISNLARCHATTGRTREAVDLLSECAPQMRDDTYVNLLLAHLQLWLGLDHDYNATRRWMIGYAKDERDGLRSRADILERAVLIACLAPLENDGQGKELLATLARCREIRAGKGRPHFYEPGSAWRGLITGILSYRVGDYESAEATLSGTLRLLEEGGKGENTPANRAQANLYRAMSMFGRGKTGAARELYSETARMIPPPPDAEHPLLNNREPAGHPLIAWLAQREARALIDQTQEDTAPRKNTPGQE